MSLQFKVSIDVSLSAEAVTLQPAYNRQLTVMMQVRECIMSALDGEKELLHVFNPILPECDATTASCFIQKLQEEGRQPCKHGKRDPNMCKECGGAGICQHGRHPSGCKEC